MSDVNSRHVLCQRYYMYFGYFKNKRPHWCYFGKNREWKHVEMYNNYHHRYNDRFCLSDGDTI